jgi:hypothetical protein
VVLWVGSEGGGEVSGVGRGEGEVETGVNGMLKSVATVVVKGLWIDH